MNGDLTLMGMAIVGGIRVMLMIHAIGGISSAHMNLAINFVFLS
jgi:glycerol uptake facilitator-like aquaporin